MIYNVNDDPIFQVWHIESGEKYLETNYETEMRPKIYNWSYVVWRSIFLVQMRQEKASSQGFISGHTVLLKDLQSNILLIAHLFGFNKKNNDLLVQIQFDGSCIFDDWVCSE